MLNMLGGIKKNSWLILFFLGVVIHIATLDVYPFPWFDEVYFASITKSLSENGTFVPSVVSTIKGNSEALAYGPLYFSSTSFFTSLFGFSAFTFRLTGLIFGLVCAALLFLITKNKWAFGLLVIDPFFGLAMHQGRMETMAACFILASLYFLVEEKNIVAGIMIGIAVLVTPRIFFFIPPFALLVFLQKDGFKSILKFFAPFIVIYIGWVYSKFGGVFSWVDYYRKVLQGNETAVHGYFGGNCYIPIHEWLLILITLAIVAFQLFKRQRLSRISLFSLISIVGFYLFVKDWGPYSILILPFYYLILFDGLRMNGQAIWGAVVLLVCFNLGYTVLKTYSSIIREDSNKNALALHLAALPKNSRIAGPATFYYEVINADHNYQLHDKYANREVCADLLINDYQYDYLLLFGSESDSVFLSNAKHIEIARSIVLPKKGYLHQEKDGFILYKRVKE